ncbi:MAG: phytanoyl-CoA dioxygenase family protein [Bacteroidia bacterium]
MIAPVKTPMPAEIAAWQPVPPTIVRDAELLDEIVREGFAVRRFLPAEAIEALREIYKREHAVAHAEGAMFYTLYSQNLEYRQRVDREVGAVMQPYLQAMFQDYKTVLHGFIVKVPGPKSGFLIHQDTTGLDEFKFSSLSVWVPLWDIDRENGALCMVRRSHKMGFPYRGISFAFPFDKIHGTVKRYLEPVFMQAGEAIIFDQRTFHASLPNRSENNRVVAIAGLFPKEAEFQIAYQESPEAPIELYRQEDDFILKYPRFMHDCRTRPVSGEKFAEVDFQIPLWTEAEFVAKAEAAGLVPLDLVGREDKLGCNPIPEPDGVERAPLAPVIKPEPEQVAEAPVPEPVHAEANGGWWKRLFGK